MENATKALLIAGSVLIAILLIAVGLRIFNSTQGTTEAAQTTMNSTEVTMFNNKFVSYVGSKTSSEAISLINTIISNNASSSSKVSIYIKQKNGSGTILYSEQITANNGALYYFQNNIKSGKVEIKINSVGTDGRITIMEIDEK